MEDGSKVERCEPDSDGTRKKRERRGREDAIHRSTIVRRTKIGEIFDRSPSRQPEGEKEVLLL